MTFLTKPSLVIKKTPLIQPKCDEEVIEVHPGSPRWTREPRMSLGSLLCMTLAAFLVTLLGIATGFMLYRHYIRTTTQHRYQGYCTIPIKDPALYESNYRVMPLRWSPEPEPQALAADSPDLAALHEEFDIGDSIERILVTDNGRHVNFIHDFDANITALHEEFDIGDSIERILVTDNGRHVNFIHDFDANITGIVDTDRCFSMDLEPELVLPPAAFVLSIEGGAPFDVSRVRTALRAALPALQQAAAALAARCSGKPVYRLLRDEGVIIRKRSADAPPHDYMVFAGRHVQEIEITNLADLLQHEQGGE